MKIATGGIENKIGNAVLLVNLADLESKVNFMMFFWYIQFTSSQN